MAYETEIEQSHSNKGDVFAAWALYLIVVFSLVGYSLVHVLT